MREIGARTWSIAEGYIPPSGRAGDRALESHETACLLNAGDAQFLTIPPRTFSGGLRYDY